MVKKAIAIGGQDAAIEFAAALMTAENSPSEHQEHLRKVMLGAKDDPLLAENIVNQFSKTFAAKN